LRGRKGIGLESLAAIEGLYDAYLAQVSQLYRGLRPLQGFFGFQDGPQRNPCHRQFAERMEAALADASSASPAEILEVLRYMYRAPLEQRESRSAWWMLLAVQKLTIPLLPRLSPADTAELYAWYRKNYPSAMQLPPQKEILRQLKALGAGAP